MRLLSITFLFLLASCTPLCQGFNVTKILLKYPEFSTFNHYLSVTHLADEINRRLTITVLAVSNGGMAPLLSRGLSLPTMRHVLSLHCLVDYYGARKLHQLPTESTQASSFFQETGAPGTSGFVNISMHKGGVVTFAPSDSDSDASSPASFVKSIFEQPYNISVIQISSILNSPVAEAPAEAPTAVNLTELMSAKGCKTFADLLLSTGDAATTFQNDIEGGLTVFCPLDQAMDAFLPKFKNLTDSGKLNLLLYHAIPVYYSVQMLRSNNGVMNTLATEKRNYNLTVQNNGEVVTIKTPAGVVAKIVGTIKDEDPLGLYTIDKVLEPRELFKKNVSSPAPAPAPVVAEAPKKAGKGKKNVPTEAPEPAPGPDQDAADQKAADENRAGMMGAGSLAGAVTAVMAILVNFMF
ncbi:fasciclin-like arabinogalactan protein 2 [Carex littledalei]|uniref:Fasciclin-like arabinogalactan protein 2 n=1 Tax=Carex littledalei TaxID=544730 RepID=A0A833VAU8_9POAL|nr:fasciclin-like arabinogalactan protein 2 [Carex littledalei]